MGEFEDNVSLGASTLRLQPSNQHDEVFFHFIINFARKIHSLNFDDGTFFTICSQCKNFCLSKNQEKMKKRTVPMNVTTTKKGERTSDDDDVEQEMMTRM
jgi:hypothetical protein